MSGFIIKPGEDKAPPPKPGGVHFNIMHNNKHVIMAFDQAYATIYFSKKEAINVGKALINTAKQMRK